MIRTQTARQFIDRLASEHPSLTPGQILTILVEEHELLTTMTADSPVNRKLAQATMERIDRIESQVYAVAS